MNESNNRVEQKLDNLIETVSGVDKKVGSLETMMSEREKLDKERNCNLDKRVKNLEDNQGWIVKTILGIVILAVIGLVITIK